jgi:hemerythrin-like domain-containing protein
MNEFLKDVFIKDMADVNRVEGITDEYVWYNSKLLINKMSSWQTEFEKITMVMEARHKEHLKIISNLLDECKKLKDGKDAFDKYAGETKREWKDLTDEDYQKIHQSLLNMSGFSFNTIAKAIEDACKDKNK